MSTSLLALLLLLSPQSNRASIEGRAVRLASGDPIVGARILLAKIEGKLSDYRTATTNETGAFVFANLAPGRYRVFAEQEDYVRTEYGQAGASPAGTPITLKSAEAIKGITVTLTPTGTITGRVYDAEGNPARDVWVYALRPRYSNVERTFEPVQPLQRTDDRGEYRLFGLEPASYFISAVPFETPRIEGEDYVVPSRLNPPGGYFRAIRPDSRTPGADALVTGVVNPAAFVSDAQVQTYHPGTTDPAAAIPIEVRPGVTIGGLDLRIARVRTVRDAAASDRNVQVRGRVLNGVSGQPAENVSVSLVTRGTTGIPSLTTRSQAGQNAGVFIFPSVIPGAYEVRASSQTLRGRASVDIGNEGLESVALTLQPSPTIQGRVRVEGRRTPDNEKDPELAGLTIQVLPGGLSQFGPDRTVAIETQGRGEYRVALPRVPPHLYVKSLKLGPMEILNSRIQIDGQPDLLEIVLSTNGGKASGVVLDAGRRPVAGSRVALVPAPALRTRVDLYKTATTDSWGRWEVEGIAPGEYKVFAWERIEADAWQDPGVLFMYENLGTRLTVTERDKHDITLRVIPSS